MPGIRGRAAMLLCALAAYPSQAAAQCPNGAAPPCPVQQAVVHRPLNDRNWLILPFENLARDPALDVVRDASVTLLYSAMSQWSDLNTVDDTRVTDLLRGVPAGTRLGQETGFELARRVGAGRLVMGTLIKEGNRTRIQAAVFDVRNNKRLRSPSLVTVGTDSLSAVFADLAGRVLAVPAPPGTRLDEVGTTSAEALRAYVAGLEAERRWVADTAVMHFRRAVALDSTFGLAHYHIHWNIGALPDEEPAAAARALATARRFSAGMPSRERGQVASLSASATGDWKTACSIVDRMLAADSLDAWAWWAHGHCRRQLLLDDTTAMLARYQTDNDRVRDWRRAAALDSTFLNPVLDAVAHLEAPFHTECRKPSRGTDLTCPDAEKYRAAHLLDHDTLVNVPRPISLGGHLWAQEPGQFLSLRRRFEISRDMLARFVAANPTNWRGHLGLSYALIELGDVPGALRELEAASAASRFVGVRRAYWLRRFSIAMRELRPDLAATFADSIYEDPTAATQPQAAAILGRYSREAMVVGGGDSLVTLRHTLAPIWAGVVPTEYETKARAYASLMGRRNARDPMRQGEIADALVRQFTLLTFRERRMRPAADTANPHPIVRSQAWFALGDTARSRRELRVAEEELDRRPGWAQNDGSWMFIAEGYVLLGDSTAALRRLRDLAARWPQMPTNQPQLLGEAGFFGNNPSRSTGRVWLLYGDLAAAAGDVTEARRAYKFVIDLWQDGEAPVQPFVARARAGLARPVP